MTYLPHLRLATKFNLGPSTTPKETASCTLAFGFPSGVSVTDAQALDLANDCFDDWSAFVTNADNQVSQDVRLVESIIYKIGSDGHITADPAHSTHDAVSGTGTTNKHPWQVTNVVTLVAGTRGKGRFGRIYLPPQCFTMTNDGLVLDGALTVMLTGIKTLLTDLSDKPGIDVGFSLRVAGQTGGGTLREVDSIRLGRVADTQRRRRRSLAEAYHSTDFDG